MRHIFATALLLALLIFLCSGNNVALQPGGKLSEVERQNIIAIHPGFAHWTPVQSAIWIRHGVTRHVCIREGGIGDLTMPCDIFAFDEGGKVVEANVIEAPNPSRPKTITSVSPLRVAYERDSGQTVVCGGKFSQATWLHDVQKREDLDERCREILESWRRSGSTNLGVVRQEIDDAIANSKK